MQNCHTICYALTLTMQQTLLQRNTKTLHTATTRNIK
jgi:hypothetical protein